MDFLSQPVIFTKIQTARKSYSIESESSAGKKKGVA